MKNTKNAAVQTVSNTNKATVAPPPAPATPVLDAKALMAEMFGSLKTELLAELAASKGRKTPRAEKPASEPKEPKREIWVRNPFCIPNTLEAGAMVIVARQGGLYTATVKSWATKHRVTLTIAADSAEVTQDRSYVFPTREAAKEAIAWAKGLVAKEITVDPAKDFGTGNGPKNHGGRLVAVFREGDETYEGQPRGFSLGFLDTQDGVVTQELLDIGYAEGAVGSPIPHFDAARGTCAVYFGFGNDDEIDFTVPVGCLYDPRLVTDAFASEYGRRYVAELRESANVVQDPTVVEAPPKVEGKVDPLTGETVEKATVAANALPAEPPKGKGEVMAKLEKLVKETGKTKKAK